MRTDACGARPFRRLVPLGLSAILMATGWAACAGAEVGAGPYATSQAIAANAQFLEYAPPPATPGVVCLVDSGVDPNPDTNAAVIGAEAEVSAWGTGDGLAQIQPRVEGHPAGHGTYMAMVMAAPQNGWGMVGIAPTSVRVYSIRVVPPGQTTFPFSAYSYAINRCVQLSRHEPRVTVVNLSFRGTTLPTHADLVQLQDSVDNAREHGIDVVAAAGNDGADTAHYPGAYPPVIAVGASDAGPGSVGVLCEFSAGKGLDVIAPGCNSVTGGIDEAFEDDGTPALGFGTSQAAGLVSAVLAAMRAYGPTLSVEEAEICLTASEKNGGNMDVTGAFNACGLESVVQAGLAAIPPTPESGRTDSAAPISGAVSPRAIAPSAAPPLARPRLGRLRLRRGALTVRVLNLPRGASIEVRVLAKRQHRLAILASGTSASSSLTLRVRAAYAVEVRMVLSGREARTSAWIKKVIG